MEGLPQNPDCKNSQELIKKRLQLVLSKMGVSEEEQLAYIKNTDLARGLLDPFSSYFDMEKMSY